MLPIEDQMGDLDNMLQQWLDVCGERPLVPIQTARVAMWLRRLRELQDDVRVYSVQPFA